jgi:hypothetical protein
MENEEIIRLAVQLTEENNSVYKKAARNQAFMIKAEDSSGTVDTFITIQGTQNADDWKKQFETAGFKNVFVSPFRSSGNLQFSDVDATFFNEISNRAKWQMTHSPTGINSPFFDYNPYASTDPSGFDPTDTRAGSSHSIDDTNKYQDYINQTLVPKQKDKIFSGWYDGSLTAWINKLIPLKDSNAKEILEKKYAYLYGNAPLQKFLLDKDIDPTTFSPTKFQINSLGIKIYTLFDILTASNIELDDFPENLIQSELKTMVDNAKSHKFHKQYEQSDMNQFQEKDIDEETEKYKNRWTVLKTILRGISR